MKFSFLPSKIRNKSLDFGECEQIGFFKRNNLSEAENLKHSI